ncbi:MAG: hypothetical protein LBK56_02220, partial [Gracilibacteraceae bacterium]|nr:hypothetical protein [Gracilibacteraceae bacterium]
MRKFLVCFLTLLMLIQPGFTGFLPAPAALRAEEPGGGPDDPISFVYGEENAASLAARESKYFTFTPDVTGTYLFSSSSIATSDVPEIAIRKGAPWSYVIASDKSGRGNKFYLPVTLAAGELYYITLSASAAAQFSFSALRTADDHANQSDLASPFSFENGAAGWLEYAGDVDAFTLTPLRTITVELSADTAAVYKLSLYGSELRSPLITLSAGSSYDIAITDISDQGANFQPRPYTLRVDPLADDAGDYVETAEPLTADSPRAGRIDYEGDRDYYSFSSETGGTYFLSVEGPPDIRCGPYNYAINAGEKSLIQISEGETRYFYVYGNDGSEYTILLTPQPDDYMNQGGYYAAALTLGDEISGALEYAEDIDAFRLDITEPGYYSLTTAGLSEPQSVWFSYEQLPGTGFSERFLSPSTYYNISVRADGAVGAYTLVVQKEDRPLPPDPEGNTAAEAMPLPAPPSYSGALDYDGDQDWFVFTTGEQGLYLADPGEYYSANLTILTEDGRQIYRLNSYESAAIALEPNTAYYIRADGYPYDGGAYSFSLTAMDYAAPVWESAGENALRLGGVLSDPKEYFTFTAPASGCYIFSLTGEGLTLSGTLNGYDLPMYYTETELGRFLVQEQTVLLAAASESAQPGPFTLTAEWIEDDYPDDGNWWQAPLMDLDASYTMRCDFEYHFEYDSEDGLKLPPGLSGPYTFIAEGAYVIIVYEENGDIEFCAEGPGSASWDFQPDKQYYVAVFHEGEVGATVTLRALAGGDDYPGGIGDFVE